MSADGDTLRAAAAVLRRHQWRNEAEVQEIEEFADLVDALLKPVPKTREEMAAFARDWDAKVEAGWTRQEYRSRARQLIADQRITLRTCWECNSAHEHLKQGEDVVLLCFACGHYYLGEVKL